MALIGAVQALFIGGRATSPGLATVYGIFATAACLILTLVTKRGAAQSGSPLLKVDADNWQVNGVISFTVLGVFVSIYFIQNTRFTYLVPYIDPVLVLAVVLISISVPVRIAWQSLMELLNRAPFRIIVEKVEKVVSTCVAVLPGRNCLFEYCNQEGRVL